ncbi:unnamed protein product [Parnassius mnemosyne]|uniref:CCHC-type domain-containing protein n=1 Tax=Parnassius mnemosyne TaxID=213953 RepID=A0AAV1LUT7_9NEOP
MEEAKAKIHLADFGIETVRQKRAVTGGLLLEIKGPDCGAKADKLAAKMREVLSDLNVRINRPVKTSDVRLRDLDDAVSTLEVAAAMAEAGDCSVDDIKVGEIRRNPTSMGTCWVRCPVKAVRKITAVGRVRVGWGSARVELLEPRPMPPMHCFRCLERGHVASRCSSETNRGARCYACGEQGHRVKQCTASALKCPLCSDLGHSAGHRLGKKCMPPPKKKGRKNGEISAPTSKAATTTSVAAPSTSSAMEVAELEIRTP